MIQQMHACLVNVAVVGLFYSYLCEALLCGIENIVSCIIFTDLFSYIDSTKLIETKFGTHTCRFI